MVFWQSVEERAARSELRQVQAETRQLRAQTQQIRTETRIMVAQLGQQKAESRVAILQAKIDLTNLREQRSQQIRRAFRGQ